MSKKKYVLEVEEGHGIMWYLGIFVIMLLAIGTIYYITLDPDARNNIDVSIASALSLNNTSSDFSNLSNNTGSEFSNLSNNAKDISNKTKNLTNNVASLSNKTKNLTNNIPN